MKAKRRCSVCGEPGVWCHATDRTWLCEAHAPPESKRACCDEKSVSPVERDGVNSREPEVRFFLNPAFEHPFTSKHLVDCALSDAIDHFHYHAPSEDVVDRLDDAIRATMPEGT